MFAEKKFYLYTYDNKYYTGNAWTKVHLTDFAWYLKLFSGLVFMRSMISACHYLHYNYVSEDSYIMIIIASVAAHDSDDKEF